MTMTHRVSQLSIIPFNVASLNVNNGPTISAIPIDNAIPIRLVATAPIKRMRIAKLTRIAIRQVVHDQY